MCYKYNIYFQFQVGFPVTKLRTLHLYICILFTVDQTIDWDWNWKLGGRWSPFISINFSSVFIYYFFFSVWAGFWPLKGDCIIQWNRYIRVHCYSTDGIWFKHAIAIFLSTSPDYVSCAFTRLTTMCMLTIYHGSIRHFISVFFLFFSFHFHEKYCW